jgi:hypothetical protein
MLSLKDVEDFVYVAVNDTREFCLKKDCFLCPLARLGRCNRRYEDLMAAQVCSYLANLGLIPRNRIFDFLDIFSHNNLDRFIIEVYKSYQAKE